MAKNNGGPPVRIPQEVREGKVFVTHAYSSAPSRTLGTGTGPGVQYAGTRNVYTAAGYKSQITYEDVLAAWQREHIAQRLIDIFPSYTWRKTPVIIDGPVTDGPRDTEFCDAWNRLWNSGRMTEDGDTMIGLDWSIPELDRVAMMGKWAVMFLGFAEGEDLQLDQPVTKGQFQSMGPDALAYTSVYAEPNVTVAKWEDDPASPRYGKPLLYNLKARRGTETMDVGAVHWSRIIHVAHNGLANLIEGQSAIDHVFNLLQDLLKVIAGTGESGYRNADPGMVIKTQPAFEAPEAGDAFEAFVSGADADPTDEAYLDQLKEGIQAYIHGLERYMVLEGYDVDVLTGAVADPRGPVSTLVDLIAGATGIPQRLLLGNEAGELASTQDQANWSSVIETRQEKVAVPIFLRPLINRLVWCGVLPEPQEGMDNDTPFMFTFPNLYSIDPKVQAEVAQIVANVLKSLGIVVDPELFMAQYIPDLDPAAILEAGIPPAPDNPFMGGSPEDGEEDGPPTEDEEGEEGEEDDNPFAANVKGVLVKDGPVNGGRYP